MQPVLLFVVATLAGAQQSSTSAGAQPPVTLNVPGTPDHAPSVLTGCMMPPGGTTSMPGSGGSAGTGPEGMNSDAANTGVFFTIPLGKKRKAETPYTLVGVDAADMKRYANARVEVQGILLPPQQPDAQGSVAMSTGTSKDKKDKKETTAPRQFKVTAIRQVPGNCGR